MAPGNDDDKKVTRIETPLAEMFRLVMELVDETASKSKSEADASPKDASSTSDDSSAVKSDASSGREDNHALASSTDQHTEYDGVRGDENSTKPSQLLDAFYACTIGLGLMLAGLLTVFLVVAILPKKAGTPIFIGAGLIFITAGAFRLDRATRPYRKQLQAEKRTKTIIKTIERKRR